MVCMMWTAIEHNMAYVEQLDCIFFQIVILVSLLFVSLSCFLALRYLFAFFSLLIHHWLFPVLVLGLKIIICSAIVGALGLLIARWHLGNGMCSKIAFLQGIKRSISVLDFGLLWLHTVDSLQLFRNLKRFPFPFFIVSVNLAWRMGAIIFDCMGEC